MDWATVWATFSQTVPGDEKEENIMFLKNLQTM
jgi:hypothetical protein